MMAEKKSIAGLIRPDLTRFAGYAAAKSPDVLEEIEGERVVKLDANENSYGCSPRLPEAFSRQIETSIYPDSTQTLLKAALSEYTGVAPEHIVAGSGSDQLIDTMMRLFLEPGDEVINLVPTFAMFQFFTALNAGKVVEVPRDAEFRVSVDAIKSAITPRTKLILIATPNNPTGTITPRADILEILDLGLPTLVDEAYYEFTGDTVADLVGEYPNLMVLRTFSKWAGLAGLRVGYGLYPKDIANYLMAIKEPYSVNAAAQLAAIESLKDLDCLLGRVRTIVAEREQLFKMLEQMDWLRPYPSWANFILTDVLRGSAVDLQKKLERRGVLTRYFNTPLLKDTLRISVSTPEDNEILVRELKRIGGDSA